MNPRKTNKILTRFLEDLGGISWMIFWWIHKISNNHFYGFSELQYVEFSLKLSLTSSLATSCGFIEGRSSMLVRKFSICLLVPKDRQATQQPCWFDLSKVLLVRRVTVQFCQRQPDPYFFKNNPPYLGWCSFT